MNNLLELDELHLLRSKVGRQRLHLLVNLEELTPERALRRERENWVENSCSTVEAQLQALHRALWNRGLRCRITVECSPATDGELQMQWPLAWQQAMSE